MYKTIKFTLLLAAISLFVFSACKDDFDPLTELNGTRADIISMLQSEDITQSFTIDSDNFSLTSNRNTTITAQPNSFVFTDDGTLATGMIDFELKELYTKSEILRYGIATECNGAILESDGELGFEASQNGRTLRIANGKVLNVSVPNTNVNSEMELFRPGQSGWVSIDNPLTVIEPGSLETFSGYLFEMDELHWVNIDYFTKFDFDLTEISICLPEGYGFSNSRTFIVFKDLDIMLDGSGVNLPIGEDIYVICIAAEDPDNFRLDIEEVTIEEGLKVNLDPKETSESDIKKRLQELD